MQRSTGDQFAVFNTGAVFSVCSGDFSPVSKSICDIVAIHHSPWHASPAVNVDTRCSGASNCPLPLHSENTLVLHGKEDWSYTMREVVIPPCC